jgi:tetratricopeptide (TPR) repeat protein
MDQLEFINKYLDNLLSPSEKETFEGELEKSTELQEELKVAKATRAAMEIWQIESLKEEFATFGKKKPNQAIGRRVLIRFTVAAAAAVVLLLVGLWVTQPPSSRIRTVEERPMAEEVLPNAINMADQLAELVQTDTSESLRGSDPLSENEFKDIILSFYEVYKSNNDEALVIKLKELENYIQEDPNAFSLPRQKTLAIYMGAGYFKLKEYVKARAYFEQAKVGRHNDAAEEILEAPFWKEQGL